MIVIPDIHGRAFWKKAVVGRGKEEIVFLGDYLDPYSSEGISVNQAIFNFLEIIAFKKKYPENVTLLLGNHDLGYLCPEINTCRQDFAHHDEIVKMLEENETLFDLCTSKEMMGMTYLFSHSFLSSYWLKICREMLKMDYQHTSEIAGLLNEKFHTKKEIMYELLAVVSMWRGGPHSIGSIVWSDVMEVNMPNALIKGVYNVFGHTQLHAPLISESYACLDVRHGFWLNEDGTFRMIE